MLPDAFSCQPAFLDATFELKGGDRGDSAGSPKDSVLIPFILQIRKITAFYDFDLFVRWLVIFSFFFIFDRI